MNHLPKDLAILLKDKGFNKGCTSIFRGEDIQPVCQMYSHFKTECNSEIGDVSNYWLAAPTHQEVVDWFREEHNIAILPEIGTQEFSYLLYDIKKNKKLSGKTIDYNASYYEAIEKAIREALELI